jgi:hypothetical protein
MEAAGMLGSKTRTLGPNSGVAFAAIACAVAHPSSPEIMQHRTTAATLLELSQTQSIVFAMSLFPSGSSPGTTAILS